MNNVLLKSISYIFNRIAFFFMNRPSPHGDRRFLKWTRFFFSRWSVGISYKQSAVKLVVRVLKSGSVLNKTHAHIGLLNVTFVCSCLLIYSI